MQWVCSNCRSASGKTPLAFYRVVSAVTSSLAGDSNVLKVTSVTPSSSSVWRSTRVVWHHWEPVHLVWARHRSWAETPMSCIITGLKQAGLSSHLNTPGRSVLLHYSWIIQKLMCNNNLVVGGGLIDEAASVVSGELSQSHWLLLLKYHHSWLTAFLLTSLPFNWPSV